MKKRLSLLEAIRGGVKVPKPRSFLPPDITPEEFQEKYPSVSADTLAKIRNSFTNDRNLYEISREWLPDDIDDYEEFAQDFASLYDLGDRAHGFQFDTGYGDDAGIKKAKEANYQRTQSGPDPFAEFEEDEAATPNQENREVQEWEKQWVSQGERPGKVSSVDRPMPAVDVFDKSKLQMPSMEDVTRQLAGTQQSSTKPLPQQRPQQRPQQQPQQQPPSPAVARRQRGSEITQIPFTRKVKV